MRSQKALHKKFEPSSTATEQEKESTAKTTLQSQNVAMRLIFLDITEIEEYWAMRPNIRGKVSLLSRVWENKLQLPVSKQEILS